MLNRIKKNKYQILELIIIFIITLLFNLICNPFTYDDIWNYGFAYNISTGLIPYKDFNMIITPLYPFIVSLFMIIFGKSLFTFYIIGSLVCTSIFYFIKKQNTKTYYIIYLFLLSFSMPGYNLFTLLLLFIIMSLEDKKNNDLIIGIFLGLIFLTKQNIGIYLCLPTIFIKDIKRIIKRIIGFLMPCTIFVIYLLYNNILYEFIDYTVLGINDFTKNNTYIDIKNIILIIMSTIFLIYKYIKRKDIKAIYLICYQLMAYPLFDNYHTMLPIIPVIAYAIKEININKKMVVLGFSLFCTLIFTINILMCKKEEYNFPNDTQVYKYKKISVKNEELILNLSNYIKNKEDKTFIIDMSAYLIKLEANIPINKYDLLNDGNLGKNGQFKIIKEFKNTCQKEKCTFLLNKNEIYDKDLSQYNQDIYKYIIDNYDERGSINGLTIYKNY